MAAPTSTHFICQWSRSRRTHQNWAGYDHRRREKPLPRSLKAKRCAFACASLFPGLLRRKLPGVCRVSCRCGHSPHERRCLMTLLSVTGYCRLLAIDSIASSPKLSFPSCRILAMLARLASPPTNCTSSPPPIIAAFLPCWARITRRFRPRRRPRRSRCHLISLITPSRFEPCQLRSRPCRSTWRRFSCASTRHLPLPPSPTSTLAGASHP